MNSNNTESISIAPNSNASQISSPRSDALISFDKNTCLSSKFDNIQGFLLEHSNFTLPSYVQKPSINVKNTNSHFNSDNNNSDVDVSSKDNNISNNTADSLNTSVVTSAVSSSSVVSSLIGRRVAGALRKKRWFVFSSKTGKLYKFRSQNDSFPISEIDIRTASFIIHHTTGTPVLLGATSSPLSPPASSFFNSHFNLSKNISQNNAHFSFHEHQQNFVSLNSQPFVFEIVSTTKNLILEANSFQEGFAWIENLQTFRQFLSNKYLGVEISAGIDTEHPLRDVSPKSFISYITNYNTQDLKPNRKEKSSTMETSSINHNAKINDTKSKIFSGIVSRIRQQNSHNDSQTFSAEYSGDHCSRCKQFEERLVTAADEQIALEDEVKTNRDVIKILQEQLRIFNSEKANFTEQLTYGNEMSIESNHSESSSAIDFETFSKELISLKIRVKSLDKENERLTLDNRQLLITKEVLQEMLENRDKTMVSLTHQVYDLESKNSRMAAHAELEKEFFQDEIDDKIKQRMEQLQDTVIAFEHQNEFLNKEIIQQNEIRARLELKVKQTQAEMCEIEAKCSQVQSKLLSLLKELKQCIQEEDRVNSEGFHNLDGANTRNPLFLTNGSIKMLVNRLLEESSLDIPLSWRPGNRPRNWSVSESISETQKEYDELGFYLNGGDSSRQYSKSYDLNMEADLGVWRNRWDQFMSNISGVDANSLSSLKKAEMKLMLRNGVPQDYRCKIWKMLVNRRVSNKRTRCGDTYYETLTKHCGPSSIVSPSKSSSNSNNNNGSSASSMIDPSTKQIELDLLRTLPHNRHFENLESEGVKRLRKVLQAFSLHNQAVGYCQGLNRLAAVALLFMPEEEAFWTLVSIVETIMPAEYFSRNLLGAHVDQCVLRDLIAEKLPQLSGHMEEYCIEISLFGWFLTAFVDSMPVQVYLHIWDVFLNEGSKVLFRFALAILKLYEPELLLMNDSVSFNQFLRTLGEKHFNLRRLSDIAFKILNPFSTKLIQNKRQHYTAMVKDELRKIEEIRDQIHLQVKLQDEQTKLDMSTKNNHDLELKEKTSSKAEKLISFDDDSDN